MSPARTTVRVRAALAATATLVTAATLMAVGGTATAQTPRAAQTPTTNLTVASLPVSHTFAQRIPVNVVLVGYQGSLEAPISRQQLGHSTPVVRATKGYNVAGARKLGLRYDYSYRYINAPKTFENKYFRYLRSIGRKSALTDYQVQYNQQKHNVLNVKGPVLNIDAPSAESWLESHGSRAFGIDDKAYTVYLVNWWGRKDFSFHVYRKVDAGSTDPDTGEKWGTHDSRAIMAWGGSTGRSWFYDLSAGPEASTHNWDVDHRDFDGDGVADRRMPPVWEYTKGGFRTAGQLGPDLGMVVRYVAVDLLFTSSPLYDPLVAAPMPGGAVNVPVTMFEDNAKRDGAGRVKPGFSAARWRALEPYHSFTAATTDVNPISKRARDSFRIWAGKKTTAPAKCYGPYGTPFAQLYCWAENDHSQYYQPLNPADHNVGVFGYWTTKASMGPNWGLLGFADDNWVDGTQSYIFTFNDPKIWSYGYGFTETVTHEVGHHLGMSHPHDGWDQVAGGFGAYGPSYFTWVGDESNTVMGYLDLSQSFGQFDKDNMSRYLTAGYDNWARALVTAATGAAGADAQTDAVVAQTQDLLAQAEQAFDDWDYLQAASLARQAFVAIQPEAERLGVGKVLRTQALSVPVSDVPHEGDPIRFPNN